MTFKEFSDHIHKIVLYQATNKKFKEWSHERKCTLNMTIRQIAANMGISNTQAHRYIKKMIEKDMLVLSYKKQSKTFRPMHFYKVLYVEKILMAKMKKRAYSYVKKAIKKDSKKVFITRKDLLKFRNTYNNFNNKIKKYNHKITFQKTESGICFSYGKINQVFLYNLDLRTGNNFKKPRSPEYISNFFRNILNGLTN